VTARALVPLLSGLRRNFLQLDATWRRV